LTSKYASVLVQIKRRNGSSFKKQGDRFVMNTQSNQSNQVLNAVPIGQNQLGNPGYGNPNGQLFGLGIGQIMQMTKDEAELNLLREQKEQYKEIIDNLKLDNKKLQLENLELKTQVATKDGQHDIDIQKVKADQKNFMESPAFLALIEKLAPLAIAKIGPNPGLGNPGSQQTNLSPALQQYSSMNIDDNMTQFFIQLYQMINENEGFSKELLEIYNKYKANGQSEN
ncbi:MAG: hypothetical protein HRT68_10205, partial [Flavobacteriaceae bacterium]|nr:hypothetical protein [Flavobacteriaceae bacterium]